jgi:hypothetical protein
LLLVVSTSSVFHDTRLYVFLEKISNLLAAEALHQRVGVNNDQRNNQGVDSQ